MVKTGINHKYLFSTLIASFLISMALYLISLQISWYGTLTVGLWLFVPVVFVAINYYAGTNTKDKLPIVFSILNTIIVFVVQLFFCGLMTLFLSGLFEKDVIDIKDYRHALSSIGWQDRITHFPEKIPENVGNVKLRKSANNWFGSEEIYLYFNADKAYIDKELSKYKFQKIEGPFETESDYEYLFRTLDPNDLRKEGYKVYHINIHKEPHNNFSNGIAIKNNQIMYYYSFPD